MSRSGNNTSASHRAFGRELARWALLSLTLLLLKGCVDPYEPATLQRACCLGGIQLDVQLTEPGGDIVIVWSGELENPYPPPVGTDLNTTTSVESQSFNTECERVSVEGYIATCESEEDEKPEAGLRAGGWTLLVNVYRNDAGNLSHIAGSPITCQIDVPSMLDAKGKRQSARRTKLRIVEGTEARDGCFPTRLPQRTDKTPIALYDFEEGDGNTVFNRMGDSSLDLTIQNPGATSWQPGLLLVEQRTRIATSGPASPLIAALQASGKMTIEAWVAPSATDFAPPSQPSLAPARIVTLSLDEYFRNVTLGQRAGFYVTRLRTGTNDNGMPETETPADTVYTGLTHIVITYEAGGDVVTYLNGLEVAREGRAGDFSTWDPSYRLALADEFDADRHWYGEYHLVAIYSEALTSREIEAHALAGPYAEQ